MLQGLKTHLRRNYLLRFYYLDADPHHQMKPHQEWQVGFRDVHLPHRHRAALARRPYWIIILLCLVCISLVAVYLYPPHRSSACYLFKSNVCDPLKDWAFWLPSTPTRELTDDELYTRGVMKEILKTPPVRSGSPKIAFMFLTPGTLPFEKLWEKFFQGNEGKFSIYIHASREKAIHTSPLFANREIRSDKVAWGGISMVDGERRLLANALQDPENQHFVLLSDSCIPLHDFSYVYRYLMETNVSFIDSFEDPGPHGSGRYSEHMKPEVDIKDFRKGSQWFSMRRQHALLILADNLYYTKFKLYCRPGMEGQKNCYADEHYLPTIFHMVDPGGIANWSVTHVDWSEGKWHPKSYSAKDITFELFRNITSIDESAHVTSDKKKVVSQRPCLWNGMQKPCYLFARKFSPETLDRLLELFSKHSVL